MKNTWEYKVINCRCKGFELPADSEPGLNRLGAAGWELVGMTSVNFKNGATDHVAMVFKRSIAA